MNYQIEDHYRENREHSVRRLSGKMGFHNAEDAVQDAYLFALEHEETIEDLDTWMSVTLRHSMINKIRQINRDDAIKHRLIEQIRTSCYQKRTSDKSDKQYLTDLAAVPTPEELLIAKELDNEVVSLIDTKPRSVARILRLSVERNMKPADISKITGETLGNVYTILHRFRREFQEKLENSKKFL